MMKRFFGALCVAAVLALVVMAAACGSSSSGSSSSSSSAAPSGPIKVGHIADLTGAEAMVGKEFTSSLAYAFKSVNNTIAGRQVQIITADGQGSAAVAVNDAKKMVQVDHVAVIFGPTEISEKIAVANYCKQVGVPMITYDPTPPFVFQGNKWAWSVGGTTNQVSSVMGDWLYTHGGFKTIDTLAEAGSAGHAFLDPLLAQYTKEGGKVVQQVWPPADINDYSSYLTTLKPAQSVVAWVTGSSSIALNTQYYQLGLTKKSQMNGAFHGGFADPFIVGSMPPKVAASMIGVAVPMPYAPDNPSAANQAFVKGFTAVMGFPPGDDGASGPYQAALTFIQAVNTNKGDTSPTKLQATLANQTVQGPQGPQTFTPGVQVPTMNQYILKVAGQPGNKNSYHYVTAYTYTAVPAQGFSGQ